MAEAVSKRRIANRIDRFRIPFRTVRCPPRVVSLLTRFLNRHLVFYGFIPEDPAVRDAVLVQRAIVDHLPQSPASRSFRILAFRVASFGHTPRGQQLAAARKGAAQLREVSQCA